MEFTMPKKLNGETLRKELKAEGVVLPEKRNAIVVSGETLFLQIEEKDSEKVQAILASHKGEDLIIEETLDSKLAKVGLSINDLKTALGL